MADREDRTRTGVVASALLSREPRRGRAVAGPHADARCVLRSHIRLSRFYPSAGGQVETVVERLARAAQGGRWPGRDDPGRDAREIGPETALGFEAPAKARLGK